MAKGLQTGRVYKPRGSCDPRLERCVFDDPDRLPLNMGRDLGLVYVQRVGPDDDENRARDQREQQLRERLAKAEGVNIRLADEVRELRKRLTQHVCPPATPASARVVGAAGRVA